MATTMSGNPAFSDRIESEYLVGSPQVVKTMSVGGVFIKTSIFLLILVAGGAWGWASATEPVVMDAGSGYANTTVTIPGGFWLASFGALFVGIFCAMNPKASAILGAIYAVLEGYVLGAISAMFDAQTEGIVGAAILSTVCVFVVALLLYVTRIIKPTQKMAFGVTAAIGGLALLYFFIWILALFDWEWLYSDSFRTIGLVVTIFAIVLAALSLTLDFASIESGVARGAPKFMEWYSAYGVMVTLIWLYLMLLRLLALLARNR
ncbi:MAG: Bax inhibitor-1/YccA family protein [Ilumatobacteraceae bacterium]